MNIICQPSATHGLPGPHFRGNLSANLEPAAREPSRCTFQIVIYGNPNINLISTSYVERQNLTMRMSMRRFTRLTNAFSKKIDNLEAAVTPHFMYYNFCRIHKTLRVPPAMETGVANHVWSLEEIIELTN
jgi:hypothetical protein